MCEVVSGILRWVSGVAKDIVQNGGRQVVVGHKWSPKTSLKGLCWLLDGWNEAKSTLWIFWLLKQAATLDIATPDTCQCLKPPFKPFTSPWIHTCYLNRYRLKFRVENNSTVVWLFGGGVNLILPDVRFWTVSQDWVAMSKVHFKNHLASCVYQSNCTHKILVSSFSKSI